jgi:hypothetical protein
MCILRGVTAKRKSRETCAFNEGIKSGVEKGREIFLAGWCLICPMIIRIAFCYHPDSAMSVSLVRSSTVPVQTVTGGMDFLVYNSRNV